MSELATTATTTYATLDPIALIQRSGKAENTKRRYTRALRPYLDTGGSLTNDGVGGVIF